VINAQGELQASETLAEAARVLQTQPASIQLRYLQTVTEIAAENNSTTIFPIPIDILRQFLPRGSEQAPATGHAGTPSISPVAAPPALAASGAGPLPQFRTGAERQPAVAEPATEQKPTAHRGTS
jgi:hypothetical protein